MGILNERYVCWDCEETILQTDEEYFESETPACPDCGTKMKFFDSEEIGVPDSPEFE